MIEDSDYSYIGAGSGQSSKNILSKPSSTMQTSRLSVFLQQNKESPATFSKPSTYGFSNGYNHDSPVIRRTRNDDEYYGGFSGNTRSSSSRRSGRGNIPGYQQDTLTSIRRSKERSQTQTDSPTRFRRTPSNRSRPVTKISGTVSSSSGRNGRPGKTGQQTMSSLSRTPSYINNLCPSSTETPLSSSMSNRRDNKQIDLSVSGHLSRYGSVRAPPTTRHDHNLLRSFSLRRKGPEDFLHTASMPCLANPDIKTSSARDKNSNYYPSVGRPSGES